MTRRMVPGIVFAVAFGLAESLVLPMPEARADFRQPGRIAEANGWILSLRADRFQGVRPAQAGYVGAQASITDDPWMYPVIVLDGSLGTHLEYSLLSDPHGSTDAATGDAGSVYPVWDLRLESDWDGDGFPEVYLLAGAPLRITWGSYPRGGGGSNAYLLRPGSSGWKKIARLPGSSSESEVAIYQEFTCAAPDGKTMPPLRVWTFAAQDEYPKTRYTLTFQKMTWRDEGYQPTGQAWSHGFITSGDEVSPARPRLVLDGDQVYLRASADRGSASAGLLSKGTLLEFLAIDGSNPVVGTMRGPWVRVNVLSGGLAGRSGWIFGLFVAPQP
jgi:hypothetical protein